MAMWVPPGMRQDSDALSGIDLTGMDGKDLSYALREAQDLLYRQAAEFTLGGMMAFSLGVCRDEKGDAIEPAAIHWSWFAHIFHCWKHKVTPIVLAPWGHGKSVSVAVNLPLWFLGHSPDIRVKIVCNADDNSVKRVRAVRSYIGDKPRHRNKDLSKVFPRLRRGKGPWGDHAIVVERSPNAIAADSSLEAHGVFGVGIGGRCDLLIGDDVPDRRNTIEHPSMRPRVIQTIKGTWQSRLEPTGRHVEVCTRWHDEDLTADRMGNAAYCVMVQRINEKMDGIDCEIVNPPAAEPHPVPDRMPLWSERWGKPALKRRRAEIGEVEYKRGFEQRAISDDDLWFPSWELCHRPVEIEDIAGIEKARVIASMDPAGKKRRGFGMMAVALLPEGYRVPIDIRLGRWTQPEALRHMDEVDARYAPRIVGVESNGVQDAIQDWARTSGKLWWPRIKAFQTQTNKADPERGLRGLEVEFAQGAWIWPTHEPVDPRDGRRKPVEMGGVPLKDHLGVCDCAWCEFDRQVRTFPAATSTDLLMCQWFNRELLVATEGALSGIGRLGDMARNGQGDVRRGRRSGMEERGKGAGRKGRAKRKRHGGGEWDWLQDIG